MRQRTLAPVLVLIGLSILSLFASACSSGGAKSESGVIAGISFIDKAGLHDIDVAINEKGEVPATARASVLKVAATLRTTEWPSKEQSAAKSLADKAAALAEALDKEPVDMKAAGILAEEVHDDAHEFSEKIWESLYEKADLPHEEDGH